MRIRDHRKTESEDENLSDSGTDYSAHTNPPAYHKESNQPGHNWEPLNSEDYYAQDVDWRANPSPCEGESLDSQDNDLQGLGPINTEFSLLDSFSVASFRSSDMDSVTCAT